MVQTEYICFTNQPALAANQLQMHCPRITLINFQRFTLYIKWKCLSGWIFLSTFPYLHHLSVNFPVKWCNFSSTLQAGADPSWARRQLGGELLQPAQLLLHGPEHDRQLVRGRAMHFQGENYTYFYLTYLNDYLWNIYPYLNEWVLKNIYNERWMPEQSAPDWPPGPGSKWRCKCWGQWDEEEKLCIGFSVRSHHLSWISPVTRPGLDCLFLYVLL